MSHVRFAGRRIMLPRHPLLRALLGIALIVGGLLGFLPILRLLDDSAGGGRAGDRLSSGPASLPAHDDQVRQLSAPALAGRCQEGGPTVRQDRSEPRRGRGVDSSRRSVGRSRALLPVAGHAAVEIGRSRSC